MDQPAPGTSDLGISSQIVPQDVRIHLTRIPFDDFFHLEYVKDGRKISEELEADDTRKWFKDHQTKPLSKEHEKQREEALEKVLDECWNFYDTWVTIPAELWQDPVRPFPQFQPQV